MSFGAACVPWRIHLARPRHHEVISFMVQMSCNDGIAHESDSGMLVQSVSTINMGVFKMRAHCFAHAVVGTMWKCWLHVALLCVMLVVVGIMTRCANQVVSCMHGHLDTMGNPWCHGRC